MLVHLYGSATVIGEVLQPCQVAPYAPKRHQMGGRHLCELALVYLYTKSDDDASANLQEARVLGSQQRLSAEIYCYANIQ